MIFQCQEKCLGNTLLFKSIFPCKHLFTENKDSIVDRPVSSFLLKNDKILLLMHFSMFDVYKDKTIGL